MSGLVESRLADPPSRNNYYAIFCIQNMIIFSGFRYMVIWQLLVKKNSGKQVGPTPESNSILKCILSWVYKSWLDQSWHDQSWLDLSGRELTWLGLFGHCIISHYPILVHHSSYLASIQIQSSGSGGTFRTPSRNPIDIPQFQTPSTYLPDTYQTPNSHLSDSH